VNARTSLNTYDRRIMDTYQASIREIPLLSHKETLELGRQKDECKDEAIRKSLIKKLAESNLRLVVKIALGFRNTSVDVMDLVQEGNQGLLVAAKRYDYKLGNQFSTYAGWWIRSYIYRYILNNSQAVREPIKLQEHRRILNRSIAEKNAASGEFPDVDELSESTGIKSDRIRYVIEHGVIRVANNKEGDEHNVQLIERLPDPEAEEFEQELYEASFLELPWEMHERIISLTGDPEKRESKKRQFQAFVMYYYHGMTLQQIGDHFNVSRERARQLRQKFYKRYIVEARRRHHSPDLLE